MVLATKSGDISGEVLKALQDVSSQIKGEHVLDVYKPYRTRRSTVKISSFCNENDCHIMLFLKIGERTFQRELEIKYMF